MGKAAPREYVRVCRHDDFVVLQCPDDKQLGYPLLTPSARFGSKALASMSLIGMLPVGAVLKQNGVIYLYYADALYELDGDGYIISDVPAFEPVKKWSGEAIWGAVYNA